jgi:hypothetical protein
MNRKVSIALANLEQNEGSIAKDRIVWDAVRDSMDDETRARCRRLAQDVKKAQRKNGVHQPICGELIAAEVLAAIGMLLIEEEG